MPALPPVANVLRLGFDWSISLDATAFDRVFVAYTGIAPSNATCDSIANSIYTGVVADLLPLTPGSTGIIGVTVTDLTSPTAGNGFHIATTAGTRPGNPNPAGAAVLCNSHINRRYRGGKPRTYWPFGVQGDLLNQQEWQSSALTDFLNGLNNFFAGVAAIVISGCALGGEVNVSYYEGFTAVTNPITGRTRDVPKVRAVALVDDVVSRTINTHVASQRRRNQIRA